MKILTKHKMEGTGFYGKFIKTQNNRFSGKSEHMFVVLKNKDYPEEKMFKPSEDGPFMITLKDRLFDTGRLEKQQVYYLQVLEMGEYLGHDFIKSLNYKKTSERKADKLLSDHEKRYPYKPQSKPKPVIVMSDSESDEETFTQKRKKKQTRKKKKFVMSDSDSDSEKKKT